MYDETIKHKHGNLNCIHKHSKQPPTGNKASTCMNAPDLYIDTDIYLAKMAKNQPLEQSEEMCITCFDLLHSCLHLQFYCCYSCSKNEVYKSKANDLHF